jgi:hypothetical protein
MGMIPQQKLSLKEKLKVDEVRGKNNFENTIDYYIDESEYENDVQEVLDLYAYLEDEINEKHYEYVLNPFNTKVAKYKRFGVKLRNFNIIRPVVDLYVGEYGERLRNIEVLDVIPEDENRYKEGLGKLIEEYHSQKLVNDLIAAGVDIGEEKVQEELKAQVATYNKDFDSNRVITGKEVLDYINFNTDAVDKYTEGYLSWLVTGRVCTYKSISWNDVKLDIVPEWEVSVPRNYRGTFYEDAPRAIRRRIMQPNEILDLWRDKLDEDTITWLDEQASTGIINSNIGFTRMTTQWIESTDDYARHSLMREFSGIPVYHCQYRTFEKVGELTFIDNMTGSTETMEVDETYKLNELNGDISISWGWKTQVIEGTRIDEQAYVDVRPLPYDRADLNNSSEQKLSYNGRMLKTVTGNIVSLVKSGINSQILYNIMHYQYEKISNKNKDKLTLIPLGLIPKGKNGWDEEKFFYTADASGHLVFDETAPTAALALQGIKVLDRSLGNYMSELSEQMMAVKTEWWDNIGMNRQRFGDIKASDGKGISEQAVYRSAVISAELNRKYEKFEEKDYQGLLDLSKLAYIDGKKAKYINSEGRQAFLEINPDDAIHRTEASATVFVQNSAQHQKDVELMKQYAFSVAQNGGKSTMWLEMIGSTNFSKSKEVIKKIEEQEAMLAQQQEQQVLESNQAIEEAKRASEQADRDIDVYKADKDYDKAIDVKMLELEGTGDTDKNSDGISDKVNDTENVRMNNHKIADDNFNNNLAYRDMIRKERETKAKITQMQSKPKTVN